MTYSHVTDSTMNVSPSSASLACLVTTSNHSRTLAARPLDFGGAA